MQNELEIGPLFFNTPGTSYSWNPRSFYSYHLDYPAGGRPATLMSISEVKEIGANYKLLEDFLKKMHTFVFSAEHPKAKHDNDYYRENFQHIEQATRQFVQLRALPRYSGLTIIGLFSIIESLITHNPKQNIEDSLNHQIKTKMPLLRKKFQRQLDYEKYFSPATEETIWGKLYSFRSKIVHDGNETIEKDIAILNSLTNVTDFLRDAVKLLILLSLTEPQFLTDLKKC